MNPAECNYRSLAELHRPTSDEVMAQTVRELASQGLTVHDIASTLNIHTTAVHRMLTPARAELAATN